MGVSLIQSRCSKGDCQNPTTSTCSRASISGYKEDRVSSCKEANKGTSQGGHSEEEIETCFRRESTFRWCKNRKGET